MRDTYNDGYKTEDIKCIIVDFIAEDGKGGLPIMRQGTYVLCKDCKYWEDGYCDDSLIEGLERKVSRFEDDFCSRGVKR